MSLTEPERVYEQLLVVMAQAGDRRAAERLVSRVRPRLLRTARRMLNADDGAQDAVQETLAAMARGWHAVSDPARFHAWTFSILHRKCADRIRKAQRRRSSESEPMDQAVSPRAEDGLALSQALALLNDEHRAAAVLHFCEGLTHLEVALATGAPIGTAKSRIFHARRQLQAALSGDDK